mmetsp:Transcript_1931/g.4622  ORF Transcript_1931/g.4622 Transcript_1931/m.4622 type:complete len:210 (-) Transcript_1931:80-709(-)
MPRPADRIVGPPLVPFSLWSSSLSCRHHAPNHVVANFLQRLLPRLLRLFRIEFAAAAAGAGRSGIVHDAAILRRILIVIGIVHQHHFQGVQDGALKNGQQPRFDAGPGVFATQFQQQFEQQIFVGAQQIEGAVDHGDQKAGVQLKPFAVQRGRVVHVGGGRQSEQGHAGFGFGKEAVCVWDYKQGIRKEVSETIRPAGSQPPHGMYFYT